MKLGVPCYSCGILYKRVSRLLHIFNFEMGELFTVPGDKNGFSVLLSANVAFKRDEFDDVTGVT